MMWRVVEGVSYVALATMATMNAHAAQAVTTTSPVSFAIVPTVNLVAIIGAAITVGMMFQRVRELERRMDHLERTTERRRNDSES